MRKIIAIFLFCLLAVSFGSTSLATKADFFNCLHGDGAVNCLDHWDGAALENGAVAMVIELSNHYLCYLDEDSGATEVLTGDTPIVAPHQNAGDKRWLCAKSGAGTSTNIPFELAASFHPQTIYDNNTDHELIITPYARAGFTVSRIYVQCNVDPTTEPTLTFQECDAGVGCSNSSTIEAVTTSAGVANVTTGFDDASIAGGNKIRVTLTDPDDTIDNISITIEGTY